MLKDGMRIEARHVRRKQLSQYIDVNYIKRERKVSETQNNTSLQLAKKRLSAEIQSQIQEKNSTLKRSKLLDESVSSNCRQMFNLG